MNLREDKMNQTSSDNQNSFSNDKKQLQQPNQNKQIKKPSQQKKIQQSTSKHIVQSAPLKRVLDDNVQRNAQHEKWIRKEAKQPLPAEALEYQNDYDYEKEHSQYLITNKEDVIVHWRGPDFEHYPRSKNWYLGISITIALICLYALWTDSIIMAIVFGLIWIVGYLQLSRPPKVIDFAVTYDGILVGDEMYDFDDIKSFWIFYEPPHTRIISLHVKGHLRPYLHIPLHQVDPVIVHEKLVEFIPEEKQEQNLIDILERLLHI